VVLAGPGRRAALEALALHDPAPLVRATALQYLARLAVVMPDLWQLLAGRLGDEPHADGRRTLLENVPPEPVPALRDAVVARLDDSAADVRAEAIELVMRWSRFDRSLHALLWKRADPPAGVEVDAAAPVVVRGRAGSEPDEVVRARLLREWLAADGIRSVLRALVGLENIEVALEALSIAVDGHGALTWDDVACLAAVGGDTIRDAIVSALEDRLHQVPVMMVLEYAVRYELVSYASFMPALADGLPALQPGDLAPALRAALTSIAVEIGNQIRYGIAIDAGEEPDPDLDPTYSMDFDNTDVAGLVADLTHLRSELIRLS
jgi:hypothetical protein